MKSRSVPFLTVRRKPGNCTRGLIDFEGVTLSCALGRGGLKSIKREGDGGTPIGSFSLLYGYFRADRVQVPQTGLPFFRIQKSDGWCDASGNANYNRPVKLPYPASCEEMQRADHLYDICIVMDVNIWPRQRNAGSAIFFHLARNDYSPTEGCIALSKEDMIRLLPFIGPQTRINIDP